MELTDRERAVVDCLRGTAPQTIYQLRDLTGIGLPGLQAALVTAELKGYVKRLVGNRFVATSA